MPASISLRVYQLTATRTRARDVVAFDAAGYVMPPRQYLSEFIAARHGSTSNQELERAWAFEQRESEGTGSSKGFVRYGTFGFSSDIKDVRTRKTHYNRKVSDLEEIPLFYEFWSPERSDFALVAFQSFAGRSCVHLVLDDLIKSFEQKNPGYRLRSKKLIPVDLGAGHLGPPVKRLTLIRHNASPDITGRYLPRSTSDHVDIQLSFIARRSRNLGPLGNLSRGLPRNATGLVVYDGISFDEVTADVSIGNKVRRVGVFGSDTEAGVIDLTETVARGADGHPTFESLSEQSDEILTEFYHTLVGR